ncbi:hypothetical protein PLICRDRAFT_171111 [Plicaturopsis crispa FD-325 SS-3]|nr:hypothetical protein PLICRDRAFT_171111 [Plicaturopsis crispa FD-325 SS-3]
MVAVEGGLHTLEISARPAKTWSQTLNGVIFFIVFNLGNLMINSSQFAFLLPLRLLPFDWARVVYNEGIRYTKGSYGTLLVLISQWFAPTRLVVTFETEGQGRLTEEEIRGIVERNPAGEVTALRLPTKSILIANHQVYLDWLYAWCLTYFMGTHKDVFIVLKKSLKWVPIIGWGMQFFDFIFLARSWASDRVHLATHLSSLGRQAQQEDKPLTLILYPEGTLVSKDTRPISKKYADKMGIDNMVHTLLPRSTGLHYSLRSLAPRMPSLRLIDVTMVYPGVPPMGYGQNYYTLFSVFFTRVPPPAIHMHIRVFDVANDVPIGDISNSNPSVLPTDKSSNQKVEVDFPERDKQKFDVWLRELWREKDRLITKFHETGSFASGTPQAEKASVEVPLRLKSQREVLDAFCFFLVAVVGYQLWTRLPRLF